MVTTVAIAAVVLAVGATVAASVAPSGKVARVHEVALPPNFDGAVLLEGQLDPRVDAAYRAAAARWSEFGCRGDWAVLAAVGHAESGHGNVGDAPAIVSADGRILPGIRGPVLDGKGPVAAVPDTDAGLIDGDATWDRAVGPMQFLPQTWLESGLDADGDGVAHPDDIDDAALSAAAYLCARSPGDFGDEAVLAQALLGYNNSVGYARRVLDLVDHYRGRGVGNRVELGDAVPLGVDPRSMPVPQTSG